MRVLICDMCGEQFNGLLNCATVEIGENRTLGFPDEIHLCAECTTRVLNWVRDQAAKARDQKE